MEALKRQIKIVVEDELTAANVKFPQFHSEHEGFSVIHEEFDELKDEVSDMCDKMTDMWGKVKINQLDPDSVVRSYNTAVNVACEAIQVAAMCKKMKHFMENERKEEKCSE